MHVHERICKASTYLWFCRDVLSYSNIYSMHIDKELELVPWCHMKANHCSSGMGSMQRTVVTILYDCDQ